MCVFNFFISFSLSDKPIKDNALCGYELTMTLRLELHLEGLSNLLWLDGNNTIRLPDSSHISFGHFAYFIKPI